MTGAFLFPPDFGGSARVRIEAVLTGLSFSASSPIHVRFLPRLTAHRGKLLSRKPSGQPVYAGCFLRKRKMVLDSELLELPSELSRIFVHEVFHFAWARAGNAVRRSYEELLEAEFQAGAGGELGWSAESRKNALSPDDRSGRTKRWREYSCESFCDTGAWTISGIRRHTEFTLDVPFRPARRAWLQRFLNRPAIAI